MKNFFFTLLQTFAVILPSMAQRHSDALHYVHHLELTDHSDSINGSSVITMLITENCSTIGLDLKNTMTDGKGMQVKGAGLMLHNKWFKNFEHLSDKILFTAAFRKGDTIEIAVVYAGIPADGLIISKNQYGKRTFFSDNWPNRAHHWIPCVDDPADKASVEFVVTAPVHYQVVSNGLMVAEVNLKDNKKMTHWKENIALPTKVMVIGVAEFSVRHAGFVNNCIPVSSWVYPENDFAGFADFSMARDILHYYTQYIGPYAYPKLANVQSSTIFGGMENAGAIFYAENTVTGRRSAEQLIAHEIVHQWFGNMATEKSFAHLWLSEGFATYLTHVYMESKYGTDSLNRRMKDERSEVLNFVKYTKRPVVDSTSNLMELLNPNSYQKGGWILHMLRRQLGDSLFHRCIRNYYIAFAGFNAETKDFRHIAEKLAGTSLEQFFKQWLHTAANPLLDITWRYLSSEKKVEVTVTQKQDATAFEFPLEIRFNLKKGASVIKKFMITKKTETFSFSQHEYPDSADADPFVSLLAEIHITATR